MNRIPVIITIALMLCTPLLVEAGEWTKKSYSVKGLWSLVKEGDKHVVVLDKDFKTKKAPDLKLFFSALPAAELTSDNALKGARIIAPLKSHKGAQSYAVPDGVEPGDFKTLIIHCEKYSKLWAVAPLGG